MADSPNTKNNDYQARKEADDKRRYINQTTESVLSNRGDYNISQLTFPENTISHNLFCIMLCYLQSFDKVSIMLV